MWTELWFGIFLGAFFLHFLWKLFSFGSTVGFQFTLAINFCILNLTFLQAWLLHQNIHNRVSFLCAIGLSYRLHNQSQSDFSNASDCLIGMRWSMLRVCLRMPPHHHHYQMLKMIQFWDVWSDHLICAGPHRGGFGEVGQHRRRNMGKGISFSLSSPYHPNIYPLLCPSYPS